jgi:hypothetical protein
MSDGRMGAATAGALLIGLPTIELLWTLSAPSGAHIVTVLFGIALVIASVAGMRPD